jgi:uncharacterized membrane protein YphA (DoxX/SURF4 family)
MRFRGSGILGMGSFVCRLAVGATLVISGLSKVLMPYDFLARLYSYRIFSADQGIALTSTLPWIELTAGVFLLFGVLARGAALTSILILLVGTAAQAHVLASGDVVPCGCMSVQSEEPISFGTIGRSTLLLCMVLVVYVFETFVKQTAVGSVVERSSCD